LKRRAPRADPPASLEPGPTLALAHDLLARRSITPADDGCQAVIGERLAAAGFACEHFRDEAVSNLWARAGRASPLLVFLGHTDVVPPGPEQAWSTPPFSPTVRDGRLYARGATDMKGAVAAFVIACERFRARHPRHRGSLAVLLTSDEEGPALDGTARVLERLDARGERIDFCLVGEPSSSVRLGDVVKVGRRGSLSGVARIQGKQGHVAYPALAENPIHGFLRAFGELAQRTWDAGNDDFPPTSLQLSNVSAGSGADNVIPDTLEARFNFRYSPASDADTLRECVEATLARHAVRATIEWTHGARPFRTPDGELLAAVRRAIHELTGLDPEASTAGGTSDGRFVAPYGAQVVELGLRHATAHQVDEHIACADLERLSTVYERVAEHLLGSRR